MNCNEMESLIKSNSHFLKNIVFPTFFVYNVVRYVYEGRYWIEKTKNIS